MVLDCTELRKGMRCSYKGKTLIYQYDVCGVRPYYVFFTERGAEKRLSQPITQRDVWIEVENALSIRIKLLTIDELFLAKILMISGISILVITALWAVVTPCPNQSHQSQNSQQEAIAAPTKD